MYYTNFFLALLIVGFSVFFFVPYDNDDKLVKYYTELIKIETSRAFKVELPTNAWQYTTKSQEVFDCGTFDHVIVGAGSAGAVVASRLSEDITRQVLLLEAGGNETDFTDIPAMMAFLAGLEYNWNYKTVPQKNSCFGSVGRQCTCPRGKGLGGSSLINALMYSRGNKQDYENWFAEGNVGWSYDDVLPYLKKSEKFLGGDIKYHGDDGYLNVEVVEPKSPQSKAFHEANLEVGNKLIDYNGKEQIGYGKIYLNTLKGKRQSTAGAFLKVIRKRENLKVRTNTFVTKILIDNENRAYGVEFNQNGRICKVHSKRDIVLSAGVIGSPQILMLSGIGPKLDLDQLGILMVHDSPVGRYLVDHPMLASMEFTSNYTESNANMNQLIKEFINGIGSLTSTFNVEGVSFLQTKNEKTPNYPDVEILMAPSPLNYEITSKFFNFDEETLEAMKTNGNTMQNFYLSLVGLHPKSVGTLKLATKHWYDYPIIDPAYLTDEEGFDINTLYEGVQLVLNLIDTKAFKKIDAKLKEIVLPACKQYEYLSQDYWYCRIRHFVNSAFHPIGTCKMGLDPKRGAVVDIKLRVYGVTNLRVADASVMPLLTSGHTNAPAIMIGERVADFIKND